MTLDDLAGIKREELEEKENNDLKQYAVRSTKASRLYNDNYDPCSRRTEFERDKDRIIYSRAFKRLMEKTQVYLTNEGDHYTNRLSHTLEVTQVARSIANTLGLNQNLIEAISLGHDLGHTPFGHAVEAVLDKRLSTEDGFEHNYQSVLVVDRLESKKFYNDEAPCGLNLTNYTRYGILHHTKVKPEIKAYSWGNDCIATTNEYRSIESELVNKIDTLTYCFHDLDDAIKNKNLLQDMKVNNLTLFNNFLAKLNYYTEISCKVIGKEFTPIKDLWEDYNPNTILKAMIRDLIIGTQKQINNLKIETLDDVKNAKEDIASFDTFKNKFNDYKKKFITRYIYDAPLICQMDTKARLVAERLFDSFNENYKQLPYSTREKFENARSWDINLKRKDGGYSITPSRVIANYIAGMTDRYALENYKRMFD